MQYDHELIIWEEKYLIFSQWHAVNSFNKGMGLLNSTHSSVDHPPEFWNDTTKLWVDEEVQYFVIELININVRIHSIFVLIVKYFAKHVSQSEYSFFNNKKDLGGLVYGL